MREKIQVKIINRNTHISPQLETGFNSVDNQKATEIAGNLSYDYIKMLIKHGVLVKNTEKSTDTCEVYDLIY